MKIAAISVADVFEVMGGWPAEQQGLFLQMILKMHARSGGLPDEDGELARMFGFKDVRTFKAIKCKLLARKVISIKDGELVNDTVVMRGLCCIECAQMLADWLGQEQAS